MTLPNDAQIRHEWSTELDALEFDVRRLFELWQRHKNAQVRTRVYSELYERERQAYLRELDACRAKHVKELDGLTKAQIVVRYPSLFGTAVSKHTRAGMIDLIWSIKWSQQVENEHSRVQRLWRAMTEREREGLDPLPEDVGQGKEAKA